MSEAAQPPLPEEDQPKEPAKEEKPGALTQYVILCAGEKDKTGTWSVVKAVQEARSAKAAVTAYLDSLDSGKDGTYVAVPVRSWDPITVKTETTTRLVFS